LKTRTEDKTEDKSRGEEQETKIEEERNGVNSEEVRRKRITFPSETSRNE